MADTVEIAESPHKCVCCGYYNIHAPVRSSFSMGTLLTLRDEPQSLARFGIDLFRIWVHGAVVEIVEYAVTVRITFGNTNRCRFANFG